MKEFGVDNPVTATPDLRSLLTELQGLRCSMQAGAAASTGITIKNILTGDTLVGVFYYPSTGGKASPVMLTNKSYISAASAMKITSQSTASGMVQVLWFDKSAGSTVGAS